MNTISKILIGFACVVYSENVFCSNCDSSFHFYNINMIFSKAIDDYCGKSINSYDVLLINIIEKDSTYITISSAYDAFYVFLLNPPYYYSIHNQKLIFIYNGDEYNFFPNKLSLNKMHKIISEYSPLTKYYEIISWEKYLFWQYPEYPFTEYDPIILEYIFYKDNLVKVNLKNVGFTSRLNPKFIK